MSRVDSTIVMREQYDTRLGIFNHAFDKERPLASVAMFEAEDFTKFSKLYDSYYDFADKDFKEIWGLDVKEFFNQPHHVVEMMKDITEKIRGKRNKLIDDVKAQIGKK